MSGFEKCSECSGPVFVGEPIPDGMAGDRKRFKIAHTCQNVTGICGRVRYQRIYGDPERKKEPRRIEPSDSGKKKRGKHEKAKAPEKQKRKHKQRWRNR
jgi:hypothetical protein